MADAHYEHDNVAKLVRMANQIGAFFESQSEGARIPGIANHIAQFWEKRMRRDIYVYVDQGGEDLLPDVIAALQQLKLKDKTVQASTKV
jgi:formate dehydrogenase subunit delta